MAKTELHRALLEAQRLVQGVAKDKTVKTNKFEYDYTSSESIIDAARTWLGQCGLVLYQVQREASEPFGDPVIKKTSWGEPYDATPRRMLVVYCLMHPESGQSLTFRRAVCVTPESGKGIDKAEFGAETLDLRYLLRCLLLIPCPDAPSVGDAQKRDERNAETKRREKTYTRNRAAAALSAPSGQVRKQPEPAPRTEPQPKAPAPEPQPEHAAPAPTEDDAKQAALKRKMLGVMARWARVCPINIPKTSATFDAVLAAYKTGRDLYAEELAAQICKKTGQEDAGQVLTDFGWEPEDDGTKNLAIADMETALDAHLHGAGGDQ